MRVVSARFDRLDLGPGSLLAAWGELSGRVVLRLSITDEVGQTSTGEAAPIGGYGPDDLDQARADLTQAVEAGSRLYQTPLEGPRDIAALLDTLAMGPSASHAMDQALLGLLGARSGRSVASLLTEIPHAGVTSHALVRDVAEARRALGRGLTALKVKLGIRTPEDDLQWLSRLRRDLGPEPAIRVDVNGAWSLEEARQVWPRLRALGVDVVEDPIAPGDLPGLRALRALGGPRVAVDRGCRSEDDLLRLLEEEAADLVVIKPMIVGGLQRARDLAHQAAQGGLGVMVTTCLGSELDRQAALAVARSVPGSALEVCGLDPVASVWSAQEGVSGTLPNPLASAAMARGDSIALRAGGVTRTWKELAGAAAQIAGSLCSAGLAPGDVIVLCGRPSARWVEALYGIFWLGAVAAPVASSCDAALLTRLGASGVLSDEPLGVAQGDWKVFGLADDLPGGTVREVPWHLDGALVRLLTSGTTGAPEVVTLTVAQVLFGALGGSLRLGHLPEDRWLCCLPLHHIGGLSILCRVAVTATSLDLHDGFDVDRVLGALDRGDISLISLVPEMLRRLLDRREVPTWHGIRAILVGGAATDETLRDRARAAGLPLALTWGMSETAAQVATTVPGDWEGGGLPALTFARVRQDPEGNLYVSGPQAGAREIATGDRGAVTDGMVQISGRVDGVITSGALRLDPERIRIALETVDGVQRAHVVARSDARWGQRPVAALVPARAPMGASALLDELGARLEEVEIPDAWVWVDALPLGDLGKVSGGRILEMIQEAHAIETSPELVGHRDGLEGGEIDEGVDLTSGGAQHTILGAYDSKLEGQGALAHGRDLSGDHQAVVERHGALEVRLGVNQGHAPTVAIEDRRPAGTHGQEQLLEGHMHILKDATVEGDPRPVDLVETHRDLVGEGQPASSSQRDETPGVPDATPPEGT